MAKVVPGNKSQADHSDGHESHTFGGGQSALKENRIYAPFVQS